MKTNLSNLNHEEFNIRPITVAGDMLFLVYPRNIGVKWTRDTLMFRSSIWTPQGELVSAGFKKFFNDGEKPELAPVLNDLRDAVVTEKLDGSLLIVSKYKGELIARTRGTCTIADLDNGFELDFLKDKYPLVFNNALLNTESVSFLYEWTTPENRIVLSYGEEPEIRLVGIIKHEDYSMFLQWELDKVAVQLNVERAKTYKFGTLSEMSDSIEIMEKAEGYCVYLNNGQDIRKVKCPWYLALHRMKSELGNIDEVLDLYFKLKIPEYVEFLKYIETQFDYEVMNACRGHASKIYEASKEVQKIIDHMRFFADGVRHLSRRDAAISIQKAYGETNRAGYVFSCLDNKEFKDEAIKKLFYQVMKK